MKYVTVEVEYEHRGVLGGDDEADGPFAYRGVSQLSGSISVKKGSSESYDYAVDDSCEEVFVMYVEHDQHDTFGGSSGLLNIVDVFETQEEADALAKAVRAYVDTRNVRGFKYHGREYYIPGTGWGSSLTGIYVQGFRIGLGKTSH